MSLVDDTPVQRLGPGAEPRHLRPDGWSDVGQQASGNLPPQPSEPSDLAGQLAELATSSFDVAVNALRKGTHDIQALSLRCDQLRSELSEAEDRHRECLHSIRDEILHWQDLVNQLVEHCRRKDQMLQEEVVQRGLFEERAIGEFRRAQKAEQRMATFERLIVGIHDQILSAIVKDRFDHPGAASNDPGAATHDPDRPESRPTPAPDPAA